MAFPTSEQSIAAAKKLGLNVSFDTQKEIEEANHAIRNAEQLRIASVQMKQSVINGSMSRSDYDKGSFIPFDNVSLPG